jgi:putative hydrolase of the HAD superfamily
VIATTPVTSFELPPAPPALALWRPLPLTAQHTAQPEAQSALGCRLHDWSVPPRESLGRRRRREGLILDLDDTLYPRERFVQSGLSAVARHVQDTRDIPADEALAVMTAARRQGKGGREFQALCARFGLAASAIPELTDVFRDHWPALQLPAATADVLRMLRTDGWRMVVLTNGLPRVQRAKVFALGIHALVDDVIYAEEQTPGGKPSPDAFRAALRRLGLPARRCVCIGDDPVRDIAAARSLGLATVWVSGSTDAVLPDADVQAERFADVPAALAGLEELVDADVA